MSKSKKTNDGKLTLKVIFEKMDEDEAMGTFAIYHKGKLKAGVRDVFFMEDGSMELAESGDFESTMGSLEIFFSLFDIDEDGLYERAFEELRDKEEAIFEYTLD